MITLVVYMNSGMAIIFAYENPPDLIPSPSYSQLSIIFKKVPRRSRLLPGMVNQFTKLLRSPPSNKSDLFLVTTTNPIAAVGPFSSLYMEEDPE